LPRCALSGLIDPIGLGVLALVGAGTSPPICRRSCGRAAARPAAATIGCTKQPDGNRSKETFDLMSDSWRPSETVDLGLGHQDAATLLSGTDLSGRFAWDPIGGTLRYAADLI
jgi:hypothetical protein